MADKPISRSYLLENIRNFKTTILDNLFVHKSDVTDTISATDTNPISSRGVASVKDTVDILNTEAVSANMIPYPYDHSVTRSDLGIDYVVNVDRSITASGTKTSDSVSQYYPVLDGAAYLNGEYFTLEQGKTYTLSGCPAGGSSTTYDIRMIVNWRRTSEGYTSYTYTDYGNGVTFKVDYPVRCVRIMIDMWGTTGTVYDPLTFWPKLEQTNVVNPYSPYFPSLYELTRYNVRQWPIEIDTTYITWQASHSAFISIANGICHVRVAGFTVNSTVYGVTLVTGLPFGRCGGDGIFYDSCGRSAQGNSTSQACGRMWIDSYGNLCANLVKGETNNSPLYGSLYYLLTDPSNIIHEE